MYLTLNNIHKSYTDTPVLRGVSLGVNQGGITALLGPSGCGKTTLLRLIAGLEQPERGSIYLDGQDLAAMPTHARGCGLMFQEYALFPHLDVAANVAFGLRAQNWAKAQITARVHEMLELVGLSAYGKRRVYQLSGGERQRVALARALAPNPRLLMLDEPLAALDRELRERLQEELRSILRRVAITTLYVTHDQHEAFALADQIVLLRAGRIVQQGPPESLYQRPAEAWAARFLGMRNQINGVYRGDGMAETALGRLHGITVDPLAPGAEIVVVIAPDAAVPTSAADALRGTVTEQRFLGRTTRYSISYSADLSLDFDLEELPDNAAMQLRAERVFMYAAP